MLYWSPGVRWTDSVGSDWRRRLKISGEWIQ